MFFIVSFHPPFSPVLCPNVFVSPLSVHTEYVHAFYTNYIKYQYTRSNRCEDQAHPWSENETMEF